MAIRFSTLATAAAAFSLLASGAAEAQAVKRPVVARAHHPVVIAEMSDATVLGARGAQRPLVVQKRSFLDPGNVVAPGQDTPANVVFNTDEHRQVYSSYNTAFFGNSELPGRFDLPPTNPRWNVSAQPHIPLPFDD